MAINFGDSEYENVVDIRLYRYEQRLTEREQRVFAGMADELMDSPLVGDVVIAETDEGDQWLGVMNQRDEMMMHFEKISVDKWLIAIYWDEYPLIDQDEWADKPIPYTGELIGSVEELRETKMYAALLEKDEGGLSYG